MGIEAKLKPLSRMPLRLHQPEGLQRLKGHPNRHSVRFGLEGYPPHAFCQGVSGHEPDAQHEGKRYGQRRCGGMPQAFPDMHDGCFLPDKRKQIRMCPALPYPPAPRCSRSARIRRQGPCAARKLPGSRSPSASSAQ